MCSATHARRHITRRRRTSRTKCASRSAKAEHINKKNVFCPVDKRRFFAGAGSGGRTRTVSLPQDFESSTSANSIIPAMYGVCSHCADNGSIVSRFPAFVKGGNGDFLIEKADRPAGQSAFLISGCTQRTSPQDRCIRSTLQSSPGRSARCRPARTRRRSLRMNPPRSSPTQSGSCRPCG